MVICMIYKNNADEIASSNGNNAGPESVDTPTPTHEPYPGGVD